MLKHRGWRVYAILLVLWLAFVFWEAGENRRVRDAARESLLNRARDISNTIAVLVRSQGRFGVVSQLRLESALNELVQSRELRAIALFNTTGEIVASAGDMRELSVTDIPDGKPQWGRESVALMNLVDLGVDDDNSTQTRPIIILPPSDDEERESRPGPPGESRPDGPPRDESRDHEQSRDRADSRDREESRDRDQATTEGMRIGQFRALSQSFERTSESVVLRLVFPPDTPITGPESLVDPRPRRRTIPPGMARRPRTFNRPFWMPEEEYQELLDRQGLHSFVFRMSTDTYHSEVSRDFWLRVVLAGVALLAVGGAAIAWRNIQNAAQLQLRLLRASEMNIHLREMNLAAAGLAHETRNPLNIVRALAQVVTRESNVSESVRRKSESIIQEVDRVTVRLNEFIEYSRPREARPAPVSLGDLVSDVRRALETDIEDKRIVMETQGVDRTILADAALFRQVLFNLLLNATQAVGEGGRIRVVCEKSGPDEYHIDVVDDGPGVPPEAREDIFRPYFTTTEQGAGLGLAIVRQIVLAHHWEIAYLDVEPKGACFRVMGVQTAPAAKGASVAQEQE